VSVQHLPVSGYVTFKGHLYKLRAMQDNLNSAPKIEIKMSELHPDGENLVLQGNGVPAEAEPIFAKYEGAYVVLVGTSAVQRAKQEGTLFLRGRLLSNPMLKRCM
jgi:hypothetical protein